MTEAPIPCRGNTCGCGVVANVCVIELGDGMTLGCWEDASRYCCCCCCCCNCGDGAAEPADVVAGAASASVGNVVSTCDDKFASSGARSKKKLFDRLVLTPAVSA